MQIVMGLSMECPEPGCTYICRVSFSQNSEELRSVPRSTVEELMTDLDWHFGAAGKCPLKREEVANGG